MLRRLRFRSRATRVAIAALTVALLGSVTPSIAVTPNTTVAYIAVSRSYTAVYVNGQVNEVGPTSTTPSVGRTVYVQRNVGGAWQNLLTRTTNTAGHFTVGFVSLPDYQYRLVVPATSTATAATSSVMASPPPPTAATYAYVAASRVNSAVYINALIKQAGAGGTQVASAGRTVYLQRLLNSGWQNMLARVTNSAGRFTVGFLSLSDIEYRLVVIPGFGTGWGQSAQTMAPSLGVPLTAGHSLGYISSNPSVSPQTLTSPSGVFQIQVGGTSAIMAEDETFADGVGVGAYPWWVFAYPTGYSLNDRSRMTLGTDGNLVLYSSAGRVIWASNTAGTGSGDRLYMQNNGDLVLYNAAGYAVWASGNTANDILAGTTILPGQQYVNTYRLRFVGQPTRLTMQSDGNLVLTFGSTVSWSSNTHVPGSRAVLTYAGDLVVVSPAGAPLWHSNTRGKDAFIYLNSCGQASVSATTEWNFPSRLSFTCG